MVQCSGSWVCYMLWYSDIWIYSLFWNVGLSENGYSDLFFHILWIPKCMFYVHCFMLLILLEYMYQNVTSNFIQPWLIVYYWIQSCQIFAWKYFSSLQWKPCMPVCTWNSWDWILCLLSRVSKVWKYKQKNISVSWIMLVTSIYSWLVTCWSYL